jgi:hypothetical protein
MFLKFTNNKISLDEYVKFACMLELQLRSSTLIEESKDISRTSCLGEVESTCK